MDLLVITNLDRMLSLQEVSIAKGYISADPRFFSESGEMLLPDKGRLDYLAARTEALSGIVPSYMQMPFQLETYLKTLEQLLKHPIGAISLSAMHDKVYR